MSRPIHFIPNNVPGYGPPDGRCMPCSGVSGRAIAASSCSSHNDHRYCQMLKSLTLKCTARSTLYVSNASSNGQQRNPDFSRQNRKVFSRSRDRNRQYEDRDSFGNPEDSEMFASKNGPVHTGSGSLKFQATATPGPREKEIVELFRKVQAQLRQKAAMKEEKKVEEGRGKGKENETVDSLLNLLRKHSVQQGKKSSNSSIAKEFLHEQTEPSGLFNETGPSGLFSEDKSFSSSISNSILKQPQQQKQNSEAPVTSRPRSVFQRRSPIQQVKTPPVFEETVDSVEQIATHYEGLKSEPADIPELDLDSESDTEQIFSDEDVYAEMSDDESSKTHELEEAEEAVDGSDDLSEMKLPELRALAKSRGLKGFSRLKKQDLIELLGGC